MVGTQNVNFCTLPSPAEAHAHKDPVDAGAPSVALQGIHTKVRCSSGNSASPAPFLLDGFRLSSVARQPSSWSAQFMHLLPRYLEALITLGPPLCRGQVVLRSRDGQALALMEDVLAVVNYSV